MFLFSSYFKVIFNIFFAIFQTFQEEIEGSGVCLAFSEAVSRETIEEDAKRAATTVQHSTARVILIFCWFTDVGELFLELAKRNVRGFYEIPTNM